MKWSLCTLFCLLLFYVVSAAQQVPAASDVDIRLSGNDFLARCESEGAYDSWNDGFCRGYVMGLSQLMSQSSICPGDHVTQAQFRRIAVKYMLDHPEKTDKLTADLMLEAWAAAFPCSVKK
ncbi:MAG: Rap1a/Tai family immunity protein [Terriglobales bacterium]|jgi:hypothetical protein